MSKNKKTIFWAISIPIMSIAIAGTLIASILFLMNKSEPPPPARVRAFKVFSENSEKTCYAVVYQELEDKLICMSVAHYFKNNPPPYHIDLNVREITDIKIPDQKRDIAFFSVDKTGLARGRDFDVPVFVTNVEPASPITIYNDEIYKIPRRKIEQVNVGERSFLLNGIVAQGRSGSPAFIPDTNRCIGVVSGYFEKKQQTLVLAP